MPEGWNKFNEKCIRMREKLGASHIEAKPEIEIALNLLKEMAEALNQYRGMAGRDSLADKEGSRYSLADEVLKKWMKWK